MEPQNLQVPRYDLSSFPELASSDLSEVDNLAMRPPDADIEAKLALGGILPRLRTGDCHLELGTSLTWENEGGYDADDEDSSSECSSFIGIDVGSSSNTKVRPLPYTLTFALS